jgi:3-oxoacyl-[acyl-carrier protein] reductase
MTESRVVIVTGAAAGIGRATALRFAREGARVSLWDLAEEPLAKVAAEVRAAGGEALAQRVDVADSQAVEAAAAAVFSLWGRIDVLVNNAGIVRDAQLVKWKDGTALSRMTEEEFDAVLGVNLKGVFLVTRAVAPRMIAAGSGVILSASSVVGLYGNFGQTNYGASKGGVINMTKTWARELGRHGIRVNAVAPGFIDTGMVAAIPPKVVEGMVAHTPLGRLGRPEDIAEAYFWLASDAAAFIHGAVLPVDGGLVIGT